VYAAVRPRTIATTACARTLDALDAQA
jgi:hypothetical protein